MCTSELERGMYDVSELHRRLQYDNLTLSQNSLPRVYPSEFIIVAIILLAWLCAIGVFVNKWAKIQIVEPSDRNRAINPMNLHTIKIVKKARDSVIYHNYSASHKRSLRDRQERLARRSMQQKQPQTPPPDDATSAAMAAEQNV